MSLFNQMTLEQKEELIETSIQLKALGVSAETSGKSFDVMINSLGMTQDLAKDATLELIGVANATGMAADVVMTEFNDASSELSKYGANMVKEFKAIAGAAEATGVKISSLMSITKQFDTFEGAATHAGKLNAILGGGVINSMDLLNATEEERVRLLIQSIHASGKNFDNLNRHEKQAIMAAAGITDMNEAQKLFNQSLGEYDMQVERSKAAEKSNKEFEELAQSMVSVSDKLKQIGQSFAVSFGFMIPIVSKFLDMILFLTDNIYKLAAVSAGGLVLGLYAAAKAFQFFQKIVSKGVKTLSKDITEGIGEGLENVAEGVSESVEVLSKGIGTAIQTISKSMATSAPMIAGAIGTVASAMGTAAAPVGAFGAALGKH
jgi:hypothetical protein